MTTTNKPNLARDVALTAVFAAFLAVCAQLSVYTTGSNVPITLQTLAVMLAGAVLGSRRGALAVLLYLLVAAVGFPVLAGGAGGLAPFSGPTFGYIVSFPICAFIVGLAAERTRGTTLRAAGLVGGGLVAIAVNTLLGAVGLNIAAGMAFSAALKFALGFVVFEVIKLAVVIPVALAVHRAFPQLLPGSDLVRPETPDIASKTYTQQS